MSTQELCTRCHKQPKAENRSRCTECLKKGSEYQNRVRPAKVERAKAGGFCTKCFKNPTDGCSPLCLECKKQARKYAKKSRSVDLSQNICPICGVNPIVPPERVCPTCKEQKCNYHQLRRLRFKEKGVCSSCGEPLDNPNFFQCAQCRAIDAQEVTKMYRERAKDNLCTTCGNPRDEASPSIHLCISCYQKSKIQRVKTNSRIRYGGHLEEIIQRDQGCVVCKRPYGVKFNRVVCHHIDGNVENTDPSNLVMLCRKCHMAIENWLDCPDKAGLLNFIMVHYVDKIELSSVQ